MGRQTKITFIGDLMCQKEQNEMIIKKYKHYYYDDVFKLVQRLFEKSDYVVGNLETPVAGLEMTYTYQPICFNTPEAFLHAIKSAGVNFVSMANNHCLDRGIKGLDTTLNKIDKYQLDTSGAYRNEDDSNRIFLKTIGGIRFAFLCFTYGTNSEYNGQILSEMDLWRVDLLKVQSAKRHDKKRIFEKIKAYIPLRLKECIKSLLGNQKVSGESNYVVDNVDRNEIDNPANLLYVEKAKNKIKKAKELADVVVVLPHIGGQYNPCPSDFTKYAMKWIVDAGADLVVAGHSHTPHNCVVFPNKSIGVYSLGNFCFTPGKGWFIHNTYAEYGVVLNVYYDENGKPGKIAFSIVKSVVDSDGIAKTIPVTDLFRTQHDSIKRERLRMDCEIIVNRFRGIYENVQIEEEYFVII